MEKTIKQQKYDTFARTMRVFMTVFGSLGLCLFICTIVGQCVHGPGTVVAVDMFGQLYLSISSLVTIGCFLGCIGAIFQLLAGTVSLIAPDDVKAQCSAAVFSCIGVIFSLLTVTILVISFQPFLMIFVAILLCLVVPAFYFVSFYFACRCGSLDLKGYFQKKGATRRRSSDSEDYDYRREKRAEKRKPIILEQEDVDDMLSFSFDDDLSFSDAPQDGSGNKKPPYVDGKATVLDDSEEETKIETNPVEEEHAKPEAEKENEQTERTEH